MNSEKVKLVCRIVDSYLSSFHLKQIFNEVPKGQVCLGLLTLISHLLSEIPNDPKH